MSPAPAAAATETARTAGSFVESIGVNTHTSYSDTVYGERFSGIKQRLAELGVHHIRENLVTERPDQYQGLRELAQMGIKSTLILGDPNGGVAGLETMEGILASELGGAVDAVEGPNEFDQRGGAEWLPRLREYQQRLYETIKGNPALAGLPVIGPSIVLPRHESELGDISGSLDYGNIHSYPNGEAPEGNLGEQLVGAAQNSGAKPIVATETGYHTARGWSGEMPPVSEEAMATYMPRLFLEYFRQGVARTFCYELADEGTDPNEREDKFGLLHNDLSPKPAFKALRNTISILADPGPEFTPEAVGYTLGGDRSDLRQVLLQKRDGSFYLALWRAESVWDPARRAPVQATTSPVQISFDRAVESVDRYLPNSSPAPLGRVAARGEGLSVDVGPQVVILHLRLGPETAPGRIKFWVSKRSVPAGGKVAVGGRLPEKIAERPLKVKIQRWQPGRGHWRTVGHGRTTRHGTFRKALKLSPHRFGRGISRLRVVARQARPSKPLKVHIRH